MAIEQLSIRSEEIDETPQTPADVLIRYALATYEDLKNDDTRLIGSELVGARLNPKDAAAVMTHEPDMRLFHASADGYVPFEKTLAETITSNGTSLAVYVNGQENSRLHLVVRNVDPWHEAGVQAAHEELFLIP